MSTTTTLTWEEFLAAGKEGQRWEYVDGEVRFMSPHTGRDHYNVILKILEAAREYQKQHPEWMTVPTDMAFTMTAGNWRCPDWALIREAKLEGKSWDKGPFPCPPDVAFEFISPDDELADILEKQEDYHKNHVIQVWVHISSRKRFVEVISPDRPVRYFQEGQTVEVEELPGFRFDF